jgi:hypothetical protein
MILDILKTVFAISSILLVLYCIFIAKNLTHRDCVVWWYKFRHNIIIDDFNSTVMPNLGDGHFVSVVRKRDIIDVIDKQQNRFLRIIPCQPNHGIMIEVWENKKMTLRGHLDDKKLAMAVGRNWYPISNQDPQQC